MTIFSYQAVARNGRVTTGLDDGTSHHEIYAKLKRGGLEPISIHPLSRKRWWLIQRGLKSPSKERLFLFMKSYASILEAGLRPLEALVCVRASTPDAATRTEIDRLVATLKQGSPLSKAMRDNPELYEVTTIQLVAAGEASGALAAALVRSVEIIERRRTIRRRLTSALIYPAILILASTISLGILTEVVAPKFEAVFVDAGIDLPVLTRVVFAASSWCREAGPIVLFVGLVLVFWVKYQRSVTKRKPAADILLRFPPTRKIILYANLSQFCLAMHGLLKGGIGLTPALLHGARLLKCEVLQHAIEDTCSRLRNGTELVAAMSAQSIFPDLMVQIVTVSADKGAAADGFLQVGRYYEEKLDDATGRVLSVLPALITVLMGGGVASIIFAIMLAVLKINDIAAQ